MVITHTSTASPRPSDRGHGPSSLELITAEATAPSNLPRDYGSVRQHHNCPVIEGPNRPNTVPLRRCNVKCARPRLAGALESCDLSVGSTAPRKQRESDVRGSDHWLLCPPGEPMCPHSKTPNDSSGVFRSFRPTRTTIGTRRVKPFSITPYGRKFPHDVENRNSDARRYGPVQNLRMSFGIDHEVARTRVSAYGNLIRGGRF